MAQKVNRKKREVYGENFRWSGEPNRIAYLCFRVGDPDLCNQVANHYNLRLDQLSGRIQHYKALTSESRASSSHVSEEVKSIFNANMNKTYIDCKNELVLWLRNSIEYLQIIKKNEVKLDNHSEVGISDLEAAYSDYWHLQMQIQSMSLNSVDWVRFAKAVSMLNVKSRGMKIEKRLITNNAWHPSRRNQEGDAFMEDGRGVEIKTSFITPLKGSKVSLTGLKLWEKDVHFYLLVVVDIRDLAVDPLTHVMWVSREDMLKAESEGLMTYPGMKKKKAMGNLHVQRGLPLSEKTLNEWVKLYPPPKSFKL